MTITVGNRLAFLSGLSGVPAQQHLRAIAGFYGIAFAMLVAFSGLPTAPAWVHLFQNPRSTESGGAARFVEQAYDGRISPELPSRRERQIASVLREQLPAADALFAAQALEAFLAEAPRGVSREAVRAFLDATVSKLQAGDLARRAATQQLVEDHLDAIAQQRIDNRRRAIILVVLMMLL